MTKARSPYIRQRLWQHLQSSPCSNVSVYMWCVLHDVQLVHLWIHPVCCALSLPLPVPYTWSPGLCISAAVAGSSYMESWLVHYPCRCRFLIHGVLACALALPLLVPYTWSPGLCISAAAAGSLYMESWLVHYPCRCWFLVHGGLACPLSLPLPVPYTWSPGLCISAAVAGSLYMESWLVH